MSADLPRLYLARYGDTAWTDSHQHTGRTDLPLNERGARRESELIGGTQRDSFSALFGENAPKFDGRQSADRATAAPSVQRRRVALGKRLGCPVSYPDIRRKACNSMALRHCCLRLRHTGVPGKV